MEGQYYNLWSTDNDRTVPNDDVVIKSVYDPSPVGYSLPASNAFTGFTTTGQKVGDWSEGYILTPEEKEKLNVKGVFDKGWYFYCKPGKQGSTMFFPSSGYRNFNAGSLLDVSSSGFYWVAGPDKRGYGPNKRNFGRSLDFRSGGVYPLNFAVRSFGFTVRCALEK